MSDNLDRKQPQDANKINVHESWELEYWTRTLGVTTKQLKDAVDAVGTSAKKVKEHLGK